LLKFCSETATALVDVHTDVWKLIDVLLRVAKVDLIVRVDDVIFLGLNLEARTYREKRSFGGEIHKIKAE